MSHRVVLDTNCVISALIFSQEKMAWLRQGWQSGLFTPLVNKQTVSELLRVLAYPKFKLTKAEQGLLLADFLPYVETVPPQDEPTGLPIARDCADQIFLSLAVTGKAEVLVTGDNDLLVLKNILAVPIMTPNEFEGCLKSGRLG
jgi:putative PIN family toxin of toxin-antitoxin system